MNFVTIVVEQPKSNNRSADYIVRPSFGYDNEDLICKGGRMYAFWTGTKWETSRSLLRNTIDNEIRQKAAEVREQHPDATVTELLMNEFSSNQFKQFSNYEQLFDQSDVVFNSRILFSKDQIKREDYATNQLPYTPKEGEAKAFYEMMGVLYRPDELAKILWFAGALLTGEMKHIQKFMFLYGGKGTGKGTVIKIFKMLFEGYHAPIDLGLLTAGSEFATSQVREVPLLIDDDSDISTIRKDTNLLKLTAHEPLTINIKYQTPYDLVFRGLVIAASNERFKVKHVDSGITRRAVVVEPSNERLEGSRYTQLFEQIKFEIPYIAQDAINLYESCGRYYYDDYTNVDMMEQTDLIFAFMREYAKQLGDPVSLKSAAELYKLYLDDMGYDSNGYKRTIKRALTRYYKTCHSEKRIGNIKYKNVFEDLNLSLLFPEEYKGLKPSDGDSGELEGSQGWINLKQQRSKFDEIAKTYPAQLTNKDGFPRTKWENVTTTLSDIETSELHFVQLPENHIVIDFDLKRDGQKSLHRNVEAALRFPPTYCEVSKSGQGLHLHYIYDGDCTELSSVYDNDIEVKVYRGNASLRRKLTECNDLDIATISSGLPLKEENKRMYESVEQFVWNEAKMRSAIRRNLRKEIHDATKPSIDFIKKIFEDAEAAGIQYDLTDMRSAIIGFAQSSTNQAKYCTQVALSLPYSTIPETFDDTAEPVLEGNPLVIPKEDLYIYDVESYPNLFLVVYKRYGTNEKIPLFNPTKEEIEELLKKPLVGFYNRKYDNHMLYGALMGETPLQLKQRSDALILKEGLEGTHPSAYEASYLDVYECATTKQSLKKWEAELGILHDEFEYGFDKPLPEELWERAAEYCGNDVDGTETVFDHIQADYEARLILSALTGLPPNAKTQKHAAKFLFGNDRRPQDKFVYTDLSELFPGYKFEYGKSSYRGLDPSEGGYVYSEPGVYEDVILLDIASMHPTSLEELNYFGPYTKRYAELKQARIYVKHHDIENASKMLDGALIPFLNENTNFEALAYALKIVINIVYGMTSASYDNPFRHPNNIDNIVAKRGALFMIDLQFAVQEQGYTVVHIKTDSIKIANGDDYIKDFVMNFGKKYGYTFEHEATYSKMALVNKAVYIAQYGWADKESKIGHWEATGAQFAQPYVYKKLFSHEEITEKDFEIIKSATAPIYLGDTFVGKVAPVYASLSGDEMWRVDEAKNKKASVVGTKGYLWKLTSEYAGLKDIDMRYYDGLIKDAIENIDKYGSITDFIDVPEEYQDLLLPF